MAQGFIPSNIKRESVSCTLEYAYDDWTIARMAGPWAGRSAREYAQRALSFTPMCSTGFDLLLPGPRVGRRLV